MKQSAGQYKNVAALLLGITGRPWTLYELSDRTGICYERVRPLVNYLRKNGVVHVDHWRLTGTKKRDYTAVYVFGEGIDTPRPRARTATERTRDYLLRKNGDVPMPAASRQVRKNPLDHVLRGWTTPKE